MKNEDKRVLVNAREIRFTAVFSSAQPHLTAPDISAVFVSLYKEYHYFFKFSTKKSLKKSIFRFFVGLTKNAKNVLWKWLSACVRLRAFACIKLFSLFGRVENELYTL